MKLLLNGIEIVRAISIKELKSRVNKLKVIQVNNVLNLVSIIFETNNGIMEYIIICNSNKSSRFVYKVLKD
ncbi:MAG TPA: hypothetical protein VI911_09120 [Patescibacteria group bacterium]|nr:MAG: hypothetical protein UR43_C0005G0009 [candidate division TM6 bacterium GW2011_GWF2_33_332]HLD91159.1 hypothetical protein [Patescibacteria group bacterium]